MRFELNPRDVFVPKPELVAVLLTPRSVELITGNAKTAQRVEWFSMLDAASREIVQHAIAREKFKGDVAHAIAVPCKLRDHPTELALFGVGQESDNATMNGIVRKIGASISDHARRARAAHVCVLFEDRNVNREALRALAEGIELGAYRFEKYKSADPKDKSPWKADAVRCAIAAKKVSRNSSDALEEGRIFARATNVARDLVNTPARDCTPKYLVEVARTHAQNYSLKLEVFDRSKLEKMGAHALLAVAQGSDEPPYLIKLTYKPKAKAKKIISLVGKGVTFDSGGYSLKTAAGMETMKIDMSGAAAVLGAVSILATLKCPHEVRVYIPTVENMVSGRAIRPGDIVRGMGDKSIEILNTDAEGRLILSDALVLAEKDKCSHIIDVATLTGACVVALGPEYAGLFSDDDKLAQGLMNAAAIEGEKLWRMPLPSEYRDLIKSPIADIKNTGGPFGGAITAALFLKEFVKETSWAHLDIAGPATSDSDKSYVRKGGTGVATRTLARYVMELK